VTNQEATKYFKKDKEAMCTTLFLAMPNIKKTLIMECDALGHGIGVVFMK
jgi:hypothetical protein